MSTVAPEQTQTLIDQLLAEQHRLTAVDRFAQRPHAGPSAQAKFYRELIPGRLPGASNMRSPSTLTRVPAAKLVSPPATISTDSTKRKRGAVSAC